ncbi:MAG TPA: TraR/DksA C4-type zinc finger protein [Acidimicrobiia bacterium]|nr:TraR/DksA C4-type zinc finger protein [Acidimicrobiia bacterium]
MDPEHAKELLQRERTEIAALHARISESRDLDESVEESTGELTGVDQHLGDHASETFEREKDLSIEEGMKEKLYEIDAALDRIERGEYGMCQVCGREISDERLEAVPATRFCIDHADRPDVDERPDVEITQELD